MNDSGFFAGIGGRKMAAFLAVLATVILFVMTGHIKGEPVIQALLLGLLTLFAGANVGQKAVTAIAGALAARGTSNDAGAKPPVS